MDILSFDMLKASYFGRSHFITEHFLLTTDLDVIHWIKGISKKPSILKVKKCYNVSLAVDGVLGGRERLATDCRIYEDLNDGYDST